MSSSLDSGYYASEKARQEETKCKASKDGLHKWVHRGSWPSVWSTCKHCGLITYSK